MFKNHPKGLLLAALSNMGERFGYYIMNAVLALFLCSKFGLSDETSGLIAALFLAAIYVMSLVGGIIADRTQNYKGTIMSGLLVMALGYVCLSIPVLATPENTTALLSFTVFALVLIACGNGLFKGNLQAIVGQMYDNFERDAAREGTDRLKWAQGQRDAGFQIFYVFINVGALAAPFIAPLLRSWWLNVHHLSYNADLPRLCHAFINGSLSGADSSNLQTLAQQVQLAGYHFTDMAAFCQDYLDAFNTGIHYSFIASVAMMLVSLAIFFFSKHLFPTPGKKEEVVVEQYTEEEKRTMAAEIKQRMYALFAVLGISVFFWFSFHQNGQSLSFFARDFVKTDSVAPHLHAAQDCLWHGHRRTGLRLPDGALDGEWLAVGRGVHRPRPVSACHPEGRSLGAHPDLWLPHCGRAVHLASGPELRVEGGSQAPAGSLPGPVARRHGRGQQPAVGRTADVQQVAALGVLAGVHAGMLHLHGRHVRHGEMA